MIFYIQFSVFKNQFLFYKLEIYKLSYVLKMYVQSNKFLCHDLWPFGRKTRSLHFTSVLDRRLKIVTFLNSIFLKINYFVSMVDWIDFHNTSLILKLHIYNKNSHKMEVISWIIWILDFLSEFCKIKMVLFISSYFKH